MFSKNTAQEGNKIQYFLYVSYNGEEWLEQYKQHYLINYIIHLRKVAGTWATL